MTEPIRLPIVLSSFGSRIEFADINGHQDDWTGDRREFIGRNGAPANPEALASSSPFSKTTGAGLDKASDSNTPTSTSDSYACQIRAC
jgi:cyclic beta-1,2-glucan synthetase